jgi:tetratricopeptide (TPR) repeat protein
MLTRVAQEQLRFEPRAVKLRERLLEDARTFYQGFLQQKSSDPRVRHEASRAYGRLGGIYAQLGQPVAAEEAYRQAIALLEELAAESPLKARYRTEQADSHLGLAYVLAFVGRRSEADQACRKFLAVMEALADEFPEQPLYRNKLVHGQVHLAWWAAETGDYRQGENARRAGCLPRGDRALP